MSQSMQESIRSALSRRIRRRWLQASAGIVFGLPLCFVGPFVLASLFWFSAGQLVGWYPWIWYFWGCAIFIFPLLIRLEIRTGGNFLGEASRDFVTDGSLDALGMVGVPIGGSLGASAAMSASNPRAATSGFVELFLTGPRFLVPGIRHLRARRSFKEIDQDFAALLVARVLTVSSAVPIKSLMTPGQPPEKLGKTLHWLAFYDWIGVGEKGQKVFLYSESREALGHFTKSAL